MNLQYNFEIDLATGASRTSKKWRNKHWTWAELLHRCKDTQRTGETAAEYARMTREEQSNVKDVGGFVGGYLSGGTRKNSTVLYRSVATLDIDYGTNDVWDDFTMAYGFAAMLYSTHKHSKEHPRFRLVFPLSRQVSPAEYEPLCRKIAAELGIDLFDDTTYELPRLFYWPSTSKDADYVFEYQDGPACDVDKVLAQYVDYRDVSAWPMSSRESSVIAHEIKKAGDPTEKPGLIGAFCRAYTIEEAIANFLPDTYEPTATPDRYTYKLGSVAGGLVCYEGKYAYSHHDTDPASRQLCNAFDLCRVHLYGARDEGCRTDDITKKPSYRAMQEFAAADRRVKLLLARERQQAASDDFAEVTVPDDYTDEWKADLEYSKSGKLQCTISNIIMILEHDPSFAGHLVHDNFAGTDAVLNGLPWSAEAKQWTDNDDANLRVWLEKNYGIQGKDKINDALTAVLTKHSYHPIKDYLSGLRWDGTPRLDKLIIDYVGAEDTPLNRAITRKHFTAAVARIYSPGCKYDYCLIMTGEEGAGKSTLLDVMGGEWFSDSITTMEGKEGMEQLRSAWLIELGELSSIKRSDVEQVKSFLSKRTDLYRPAYGKRRGNYPRQCVFCGTTNEANFLKGDTGNRRFWVIPIDKKLRKTTGDVDVPIREDRDQLWAEAVYYYRHGEKLYLDANMETEVRKRQEDYNDDSENPLKAVLYEYLDRKLPVDWNTRTVKERHNYLTEIDPLSAEGTEVRDRFCAAEFICEWLGINISDKDFKYKARQINKWVAERQDWEKIASTRHAEKLYGVQRGFRRIYPESKEEDI